MAISPVEKQKESNGTFPNRGRKRKGESSTLNYPVTLIIDEESKFIATKVCTSVSQQRALFNRFNLVSLNYSDLDPARSLSLSFIIT